jgi:hypothetical protein
MASYKNISGNWYITVENGVGTIYVDGNLDVTGNITYVSELAVNDAFIIVAANNTGTVTSMGLIAQKTDTAFAGFRFNTITSEWEVSPSVAEDGSPISPYTGIVTGNVAVGGSNTQVQFNNNGSFGATGNLTFNSVTNTLTLGGPQVFANIITTPSTVVDSVSLYHKGVGQGDTGLYVVSPTVDSELISSTQAKKFSIIF